MTFRAQEPDTLEVVHAGTPRLAGLLEGRWLQCADSRCRQTCTGWVRYRQGPGRPHFAHRPRAPGTGGPEGRRHQLARAWVAQQLVPHLFPCRPITHVERDAPDAGRRPDVQVHAICGRAFGFETQLAAITKGELQARSDDQAAAGLRPVWLLGGRAATAVNQAWCQGRQGWVLKLDFEQAVAGLCDGQRAGRGLEVSLVDSAGRREPWQALRGRLCDPACPFLQTPIPGENPAA